MLSNDQMKADRYGRWARSRALVRKIESTLASGGMVMIATYTQAKQYDKRHAGMFKATKSGAFVQRGKSWDCIDYCGIRFAQVKEQGQ